MSVKNEKTIKDLDKLFDSFIEVLDLFKDLKNRVQRIETHMEGKPTEGIESFYNNIKNLLIKTETIESKKIQNDIVKELAKVRQEVDDLADSGEDIKVLKAKITGLEINIAERKAVDGFKLWFIPILITVTMAVLFNIILPALNK